MRAAWDDVRGCGEKYSWVEVRGALPVNIVEEGWDLTEEQDSRISRLLAG